MTIKLLSADDFRAAAKAGGAPDGTVFRFATADPEMQDEATRTMRFVFSDSTLDHSGDTIDPKGWDLAIFNSNPVALFSHMSWEPPIGRAHNVAVQNSKLVGDIEFAAAEVYEFADTIFRLVKGGFLKAVSVGFKPKEWAFSSDKDRPYGIDFKKQTLLEISVCPVPCNPNALSEARSIGIDTRSLTDWAEKVLDSGDTVLLPRSEVETLRRQSGALTKRYYLQLERGTEVSAATAEKIRDRVKQWQADPTDVLVLEAGVSLCTIGEDAPAGEAGIIDKGLVDKAGRRISAATKAKMAEAITHHEAATKCIKDIMDEDAARDDGADPEPDGDPDDGLTPVPPGSVVQEAAPADPAPDPDADLAPEQRRLKEARALKATLPTND